ncbi:hypothetical protein [Anatilimnocola aggregata]|uniref:hypothetical protein n=1 Tax=Anatilimnocola aggregata TaxID=2528021 RepID=UPI00119D2B47|nr:hypothetical protein [Anatilimnocola aggregata]
MGEPLGPLGSVAKGFDPPPPNGLPPPGALPNGEPGGVLPNGELGGAAPNGLLGGGGPNAPPNGGVPNDADAGWDSGGLPNEKAPGLAGVDAGGDSGEIAPVSEVAGTARTDAHLGHLAFLPAAVSGTRNCWSQLGQRNSIGIGAIPSKVELG